MNRVWRYTDWAGQRVLRACDEYGRSTLLIRLRGENAIVFALWRCRCDADCDAP